MAYDSNKLVKLGHLKELATKIKTEYAPGNPNPGVQYC